MKDGRFIYEYTARKDAFEIRLKHQVIEAAAPNLKKRRPDFGFLIPFDQTIAMLAISAERSESIPTAEKGLVREIDRELRIARSQLRQTFAAFDSISPFRDPPQRTYLYTGETHSTVGRTGSNSTSILARKEGTRSDFISKISEWLSVTGFAKSISLRSLTDRHYEICVEDLDGKFHNICDVGFGCSQVLPVLIGALNTLQKNRPGGRFAPIFVVQEPEIHLHPNAQATLGSFFVSLVKEAGQIFIETHSDALVLRIMRHIAEGHLRAKDASIFFFENAAEGKNVEQIFIDERTSFRPPWPGGFFPQRENEALGLARARNQKKVGSNDTQIDFIYPEARR